MATTRAKKATILADLKTQFTSSTSVAFAQYKGLSVKSTQALRRELRAVGAELIVAKKTLIKLAAKDVKGLELTKDTLDGPIAAIFSHGDEIAAAQVLFNFSKENPQVVLTGGILDGDLLGRAQITQVAGLPAKPQLVGQLLSVLISPIRGIAGVGHQLLAATARVLSEIEKKQASAK